MSVSQVGRQGDAPAYRRIGRLSWDVSIAREADAQDQPECRECFPLVDFRRAVPPVGESDRHLPEGRAGPLEPVQNLLEKRVAPGAHPVQIEPLQGGDPVATERTAVVTGPQAEQQPGVTVHTTAHQRVPLY